jgi:hypothetical protein
MSGGFFKWGADSIRVSSVADSQPVVKNGRPQLVPLPDPEEIWECEVVVIGGSLGGVAAAAHAMQAGATTCLIELTPWFGGQISSQSVSAIDESLTMRESQNFSRSWTVFKRLIQQQSVELPAWTNLPAGQRVADTNSCWVGTLCFPPAAGAAASLQLLQSAASRVPGSRWGTGIAFKGAEFDQTGRNITAVYAVRRTPRQPDYVPLGRFSKELSSWYSWAEDSTFEKTPIRLQAPAGKRLMVVDATDTGELVGWAKIPHRVGSDGKELTQEVNAAAWSNPECTQAFTYPFMLGIYDDRGASRSVLTGTDPDYSEAEHIQEYNLGRFPMFVGHSFFHYRRIVSTTLNAPSEGSPAPGDITMVNWNNGNDWNWMNPSLIMTPKQLDTSGQYQNWMGGISPIALKHAENHALLFARWLLDTKAEPGFPLTYLHGPNSPAGTMSGLSMVPYIREGRRILGRKAYGQKSFYLRESDIRADMDGRDLSPSTIGLTHYDIDIHGCRYRNWEASGEATSAPMREYNVRPIQIPLEGLVPQGVDNLLIGGKAIAVTHIVNAATRVHYGEWTTGAAAGATAAWLVTQKPGLVPADVVPRKQITKLQQYLVTQGLRVEW